MALQFWPRGGSAQVVRYLAPEISAAGWPVSLVTGSLGAPGDNGYAPEFFAPTAVTPVDYTFAMTMWQHGGNPLAAPVPLHPSFEDRPDAPDRVFASVDDAGFERQVVAWADALLAGGVTASRVAHLHHLTPINEAIHQLRPELPLVAQLHGTEMLMLEAIRDTPAGTAGSWAYAATWARRMQTWAQRAHGIITASETDKERALALFQVPNDRFAVVPPGVDQQRFRPVKLSAADRLRLLHQWLVDEPRGWDESGVVGSVRYSVADLAPFADPQLPVLIYVGRFTEAKRLPLLLRAYAQARRDHGLRAPLLIWGGFPGEWEGEHPVTVVREQRIEGVFFTGWHGHDELPAGLGCADVFVGPSVGEAFGQVFIEAMACGLPVITSASGGPLAFMNTEPGHPNGWLVEPDDEESLTAALVEATTARDAAAFRSARAADALAQVRARFSWAAAARRVIEVYEEVTR
jgi:glycosyltransferase involved in cell wall biosynthesis